MAFNEAEMQALALLFAAEKAGESADHAALDKACEERYWIYKEDLSAAFPALLEQGFIEGDDNGYRLTDEGRPKAEYCNKARGGRLYYHYYHFWQAAFDSKAHTQLCAFVGFYCLAIAMEGYFRRKLSWPERILFMGAAVGFFFQIWWIKVAAVVLLGIGVAIQTRFAESAAPAIKPGE